MRRFAILAAAVAACLLFTACPNKPTDEPVTIPDGMYEETARFVWTNTRTAGRDSGITSVVIDTVFRTNVMIVGGDFVYPDLCNDTYQPNPNIPPSIKPHFVYEASYYCKNSKIPARAKSDGYVYLDKPHFRYDYTADAFDTTYSSKIHLYGDAYTFGICHNLYKAPTAKEQRTFTISDTLRRM